MTKLVVKKYRYSLLYYDKVSRKDYRYSLLYYDKVSRKEISLIITVLR